MNLSKITGEIKTVVNKSSKVAKKAIKEISKEVANATKLQKNMDFQAALNKTLVKPKTVETSALKVDIFNEPCVKVAKEASEGINLHVCGDEQEQVRQIALEIVSRYDDVSPQDATKGAIELVKATGLRVGKSAQCSAKVMGTKKNALEVQLDAQDLKVALLQKQAAKKAEKLAQEAEFKNSYFGKAQTIDEIVDKTYKK